MIKNKNFVGFTPDWDLIPDGFDYVVVSAIHTLAFNVMPLQWSQEYEDYMPREMTLDVKIEGAEPQVMFLGFSPFGQQIVANMDTESPDYLNMQTMMTPPMVLLERPIKAALEVPKASKFS